MVIGLHMVDIICQMSSKCTQEMVEIQQQRCFFIVRGKIGDTVISGNYPRIMDVNLAFVINV